MRAEIEAKESTIKCQFYLTELVILLPTFSLP